MVLIGRIIFYVLFLNMYALSMELTVDKQFRLKNLLDDLIPVIAMQLDCSSIVSLKMVCKKYNQLCNLEEIIKQSPATFYALSQNYQLTQDAFVYYAQQQNEPMFYYLWHNQPDQARKYHEDIVDKFYKQKPITPKVAFSVYAGDVVSCAKKIKRLYKYQKACLKTCLSQADAEGLRLLLMNNVDPNICYKQETLLYYAVERGLFNIAQLLLQYGADVNKKNKTYPYSSPLHASGHGGKKIAVLLINAGALVDQRNASHNTPLHIASSLGSAKTYRGVVRCLLWYGADINAQGYHKQTPLYNACMSGHLEMVRLLLKKGANPVLSRPRFIAYLNRHTNVVALLDSYAVPKCFEEKCEEYGVTFLKSVVVAVCIAVLTEYIT